MMTNANTTTNICFEDSTQIRGTVIDLRDKMSSAGINKPVCFNLIKACSIFSVSSNTKFDEVLLSCFKDLKQDERKKIFSAIYNNGDINVAAEMLEKHIFHTNPAVYYIAFGLEVSR